MASGVGKPLCANFVTKEQLRIGFARVLVEVNVDYEFPKEIEVVGANGESAVVGVEYPWLLVKCKKCKSFGHLTYSCTKIEKQVWVPRRPEPILKELHTQKVSITNKESEVRSVNPGSVVKDQWNEVKSARRTPISKPIISDSQKHWTNSFHL